MPSFDTGTSWDQGLNSLSSMLFPDPSKVAQAGYYGAMQRNQTLEGDLKKRQMAGQDTVSDIFTNLDKYQRPGPQAAPAAPGPVAPPGAGAPPQAALAGVPAPTHGSVATLAHAVTQGGVQAGGLGTGQPPPMASPAPGSGAPPAPTATGSDGSTPPADMSSGPFHPGSITAPGGGVKMAGPAAPDGSQAKPVFNLGRLIAAANAAGYDSAKLQAVIGAGIAKGVDVGAFDQPTANQMLLDLNPSELGATMRQSIITGSQMVPVWDNQINKPTEVTHDAYVKDAGQRYRGISGASSDAWNAPTRFTNPTNPLSSVTVPMYQGATQGGAQITAQGPAEWPGSIAAQGAPPTVGQMQTAAGATTMSAPVQALSPQEQAQNRQIDDQVVQKLFPPTGNVRDANMPIMLDDPTGSVATATDELQRTNPAFRNNRAGAATQVIKQFQQEGRIKQPNRGTNVMGRNLPSVVTGQVGANPDVVMQTVQTSKGPVKQPRLRLQVLPPGQGKGGGTGQGAGPQATLPQVQTHASPNGIAMPKGTQENSVHADPQTGALKIVHNGVAVPLTAQEQQQYQAAQRAQGQRQAVAGQP